MNLPSKMGILSIVKRAQTSCPIVIHCRRFKPVWKHGFVRLERRVTMQEAGNWALHPCAAHGHGIATWSSGYSKYLFCLSFYARSPSTWFLFLPAASWSYIWIIHISGPFEDEFIMSYIIYHTQSMMLFVTHKC